jgi:hypothetical protein
MWRGSRRFIISTIDCSCRLRVGSTPAADAGLVPVAYSKSRPGPFAAPDANASSKIATLHTALFQPSVALGIHSALLRVSMHEAVEFDVKQSFSTEKVQDMRANRMLPSKLVCRKPPVPQPTPNQLLSPCVSPSQDPGNSFLFWC